MVCSQPCLLQLLLLERGREPAPRRQAEKMPAVFLGVLETVELDEGFVHQFSRLKGLPGLASQAAMGQRPKLPVQLGLQLLSCVLIAFDRAPEKQGQVLCGAFSHGKYRKHRFGMIRSGLEQRIRKVEGNHQGY